MNRRTFLSRLLVGLLAAPVIAKVISEPKPVGLYFDGVNDYMRCKPFKLDGQQTVRFVPGVSGNYASAPDSAMLTITGDHEWFFDGKTLRHIARSC
jgi:hypothetical protein